MKIKKIMALMLAVVMVLTFTACGSKGKDKNNKVSAGNNGEKVELIKDLGGYEFVIASYTGEPKPGTEVNDEIIAINKLIEKQYNCKIVYDHYDMVTFYDVVGTKILAGDKVADLLNMTIYSMGNFMKEGQLYNLKELPNFNMDDSCWNKFYFDATTVKSGTYGIGGSMINLEAIGALIYNKDILSKQGLTDPIEYINAGKWTWDTLKLLVSKAAKDLNNDGTFSSADDQFGFLTANYDGMLNFFRSSGIDMIKQENGVLKYNLDTPEAHNVLAKLKDMFSVPGAINPGASINYQDGQKLWAKGRVAFYADFASLRSDRENFADVDFNIGMVPFPMGPSAKSYISSVSHNGNIMAVPITITEPEKTGTILTALAKEYEKRNISGMIANNMLTGLTDEKSIELVREHLFKNITFDPTVVHQNANIKIYNATDCVVGNPIILHPDETYQYYIGMYKTTCEKELEAISNY